MKPTRNLWPYGLILTFVLFFCGMAAVVFIAATHRETMVSENYYEQELKFQELIDGSARAKKSGAEIFRDPASGNVVIAVPAVQLAQKFSGTIELYRPSEPKLDQVLPLTPRADGRQTLDGSRLAAGPWLVRAKWNAGGENYFLEQKVTLAGK